MRHEIWLDRYRGGGRHQHVGRWQVLLPRRRLVGTRAPCRGSPAMRCKVNFVPSVRTIMPRRTSLASSPCEGNRGYSSEDIVGCAQKDVDIGREGSIIVFTVDIRNPGDLADARRPGSTIHTQCPNAQWEPQSASARR